MKLFNCITKALSCPFFGGLFVFLISILALASAYTAEYGFGLLPCILCLYQRIPFAIGIVLGLGIIGFAKAKKRLVAASLLFLAGLNFLANASLAFYHTGVERKWWKGFEGCSAPDITNLSPEEMIEALKNAPAVKCDEIPWEMFGLSMANYNVAFCLGISVICFYAFFAVKNA